jgi:hypothetical protein
LYVVERAVKVGVGRLAGGSQPRDAFQCWDDFLDCNMRDLLMCVRNAEE